MEDIEDLLIKAGQYQAESDDVMFLTRIKDLGEKKRLEIKNHLMKEGFNESLKRRYKKEILSQNKFDIPEVT